VSDPEDRLGKCPAFDQFARRLMSVHPGTPSASLLEPGYQVEEGAAQA
jgi:hypothetical protein